MKTKGILLCLLFGVIYMACEDSISRVGLGIQPEEDKISVFDTTVVVEARTIEVDSVYAKTNSGFLGNFYDPTYGNIKSSYMCQYYPSVGFPYLDSIVDNKIDAVNLTIYYYSYLGDSIAPMEVTVYPIIKSLDDNYYTNADPTAYCDINNPMGKLGYTARNLTIEYDDLVDSYYLYNISIPLPVKFGQDYLDKVLNNELNTLDEFLEFFPGTYITTTFGTGSMLAVYRTDINVYYTRKTLVYDEDGNETFENRAASATFAVTKEIIQLNTFENKNPDYLLEDNSDKTFIKSPAGVFTELTIPIKEIVKGIGKKKFSSVKLTLDTYRNDDWQYSLQLPGAAFSVVPVSENTVGYSAKMLLIEPDSVPNFFENRDKVADGKTSFSTQLTSSYTYDFNNIANVVQNAIDKAPDKDLKLWLIPVMTAWYSESSYGSTYNVDYMTSHYLYPSGVALKKGGDNLKVRVIAADLSIND